MLGGRRSSDHEQAGQRQDQGGAGGEGGASREQEGAGGGGFQEVESRVQGPEDEGMKWSRTRIGVWQLEVSGAPWAGGLVEDSNGNQAGDTEERRWEKAALDRASFSEAWKERDGEDGDSG